MQLFVSSHPKAFYDRSPYKTRGLASVIESLLKSFALIHGKTQGTIFSTYESAHQAGVLQRHTLKLIIPVLKLHRKRSVVNKTPVYQEQS